MPITTTTHPVTSHTQGLTVHNPPPYHRLNSPINNNHHYDNNNYNYHHYNDGYYPYGYTYDYYYPQIITTQPIIVANTPTISALVTTDPTIMGQPTVPSTHPKIMSRFLGFVLLLFIMTFIYLIIARQNRM